MGALPCPVLTAVAEFSDAFTKRAGRLSTRGLTAVRCRSEGAPVPAALQPDIIFSNCYGGESKRPTRIGHRARYSDRPILVTIHKNCDGQTSV